MSHFIAIDIGTTTLAFSIVHRESGHILHCTASMNHQRSLGTDIMTRIYNAQKGKALQLHELICNDLKDGILYLNKHITDYSADSIIISANTAMVHFLMGYPCEGLGSYPYTPYNLSIINTYGKEFWNEPYLRDIPVTILPGISAFIGGDITSGLLAASFHKLTKPALFLDLGTNGEMVLYHDNQYYTASAAAGPALEGGRIHCGRPGIPGAISHIKLFHGTALTETIDNAPAIGICGTGVIDITAELLRHHFITKDGQLKPPFHEQGFPITTTPGHNTITFTQKDIREIQLAKSAIRAGIEILLDESGITIEKLSKVVLAGGLGYYIDAPNAKSIGLLPDIPVDIIKTPGNTSLLGAIQYGMHPESSLEIMHTMIERSKEIHLANHEKFEAYYLQHINF